MDPKTSQSLLNRLGINKEIEPGEVVGPVLLEIMSAILDRVERAWSGRAALVAAKDRAWNDAIEAAADVNRPSGNFLSKGSVGLPAGWPSIIRALRKDTK